MKATNRNATVDIIRGVAMLLVILGHALSNVTADGYQSFLYNIIWTLQMPLFILVSGYVSRYSRQITTLKQLGVQFLKKTASYLLPWVVWTFFVRGLLLGQTYFFNWKYLFWNMDSGYWFLTSLWSIVVIFSVAKYLSDKFLKREFFSFVVFSFFYFVGMMILGGIGLTFGLSFFAIKLTLYYMVFFYLGYAFGRYQDKLMTMLGGRKMMDIVIFVSLAVWLFLLKRYDFHNIHDNLYGILLRGTASLLGCISVCGLIAKINFETVLPKIGGFLNKCGGMTIQLYLIHIPLTALFKPADLPMFSTPEGCIYVLLNFVVTFVISRLIIFCTDAFPLLNKILFYK